MREYKRLEVLSFAFMESLCIYGLVIALAILFANTNGKTVIEAVGIDRRDRIALAGSNWFPGPTGAVSGIGVAVEITSPWTL